MADVIERATIQHTASVNPSGYSVGEYVILVDPLAVQTVRAFVASVPQRYRKLAGDTLSEMTAGEKTAVDAAIVIAGRDAIAAQFDELQSLTKSFALVVLDEINTLRAAHGFADRTAAQLKTALRSKLDG